MSRTKVVIGIDIGGTKTEYGFVDKKGKCYFVSSIPTKAEQSSEQLFVRLFEAINFNQKKYETKLEFVGIGIGAPNANYFRGTIEQPPNLNWGKVNVIKVIRKFTSLPAVITNDANAAALGEMYFGAAKSMKNFIVITLGTGLGSGIVVNGELVYGSDGFAGELGHTIVDTNGRTCGCGRKGCLETYVSASGIKRTAFELMSSTLQPSKLRNIPFEKLTSKDIYNAAKKGDKLALECFDFTAKILAFKLADTVAHLSPEAIILFGGLVSAGGLIIKPTKNYLEKYLLNIFKNKVKIIPSSLIKKNAAVLGAAALMWNKLEKSV